MQGDWKTEFEQDYAVPPLVEELVHQNRLEDTSWGNDVAPSFERKLPDGRTVRLWVDHPDATMRELPDMGRFEVWLYEDPNDPEPEVLYTGDSLQAAVKAAEFPDWIKKLNQQAERRRHAGNGL